MTEFTFISDNYPGAVPKGATVGDEVTFLLTGLVSKLASDVVDITTYEKGKSVQYALGQTKASIAVTSIRRLADGNV